MSKLKDNDIKVVIYGCGEYGKRLVEFFQNSYDFPHVIAFIDKTYKGEYLGIPIYSPEKLREMTFDYIIIACSTKISHDEICKILKYNLQIKQDKIVDLSKVPLNSISISRINFLRDFAMFCKKSKMLGSVAEAGVHRGDFAKFINVYFDDRKLYLFDTFEGFDDKELKTEKNLGMEGFLNGIFCDDKELFSNTSIERVREKMTHIENVVIKKGLFPDTASDVDAIFCFVNLDMDLYISTLNGLRFFWSRMVKGGCILIHDYFHYQLPGVKKAVEDFEQEINMVLAKLPIGDGCSIAVIKN